MKKVFPIDQGIVYEGGKVIPWSLVFAVLDEALDEKTRSLVRRKVSENVAFHSTTTATDVSHVAELLGVKDGVGLHTRVAKKIAFLNKKVEDGFGRFEGKAVAGQRKV